MSLLSVCCISVLYFTTFTTIWALSPHKASWLWLRLKGTNDVLFTSGVVVITAERGRITFTVTSVTSLVTCTRPTLVRSTRRAPATVDFLSINRATSVILSTTLLTTSTANDFEK